jgi:hypothetical protein
MDGSSFATAAMTTWWLVSDGVVSLEWINFRPFIFQLVVWLLACVSVGITIVVALRNSIPHLRSVLVLASTAVIVGVCGYATPFSWWRPIAYCRLVGGGQFVFNLNNLFAVPWVLGVLGLALAAFSGVAFECPRCGHKAIPFRKIWMKSTFGVHRCPVCGAKCRVQHPVWYLVCGVALPIMSLGLGYRLAGWKEVVDTIAVALLADAWFDYRAIRHFALLRSVEDNEVDTDRTGSA